MVDEPMQARRGRGFAGMDPERRREIARKGGKASPQAENLRNVDRSAAGRKGGHAVVEKYGAGHMAEIGRKGGESSGGFANMDPDKQREIARRGGAASPQAENLRNVDRSEAGRKGGAAVVERYGSAHMAEIGRKGGASRGHHGLEETPSPLGTQMHDAFGIPVAAENAPRGGVEEEE